MSIGITMKKLYKDITYNGRETGIFEKELVKYTGSEHAIATNSGTSALFLILKAMGISKGDKVITQAYSFVATANAIKYCGADPVFVDINDECCMSPDSLKKAVNKYPDAKAIIPVHLYGNSCEMEKIIEVANNIPIIEDACQGMGVFRYGVHVGTFGIAGCLSFNGGKLINTGGGGAVLTSNPELAKKILTLSTTAKDYSNNIYYHSELGYNMRMPALNAIHGVRQLKNIDYVKATKIQIEKSPYQCINTFPMYQDCDCMDLPVSTAISAKGKGLAYENCIYSA